MGNRMSDISPSNQPRPSGFRRLVGRLTTIRLHSYLLRRRLHREAPRGAKEIEQHLDQIDQEVSEAAKLARDELGADPRS
jgi:hypothetical protein